MTKKLFTMASALVLAIGVSAFASGDDNKACADKQCGSQCQASAAVCADAACCDPFDGLNLTPEQMMRLNTITTECRDAQKAAKCCKEGKAGCKEGKAKCSKDSCGKAKCCKEGKCAKEGKAKCCKEGKCAKGGNGKCCKEGKAKCAKDSCGKADCCKKAQTDSCAARQRLRQHNMRMRGAAANAEATSEYLAKVKEVLTPEQYVQFLENCVTRGATMPRMFDRPGGVKYRDPKTGRAIPTGRDGMMLQRPRPVPADSCATASAPSCCSKK
ncbi:MAG: hypothetical protein ACI30K_00660 [Muribaculaceae bacterium]